VQAVPFAIELRWTAELMRSWSAGSGSQPEKEVGLSRFASGHYDYRE
jgi:hypothetical protein